MSESREQDCAILVATGHERWALANQFHSHELAGWESREVESLHEVEALLGHSPCDVLIVDESACPAWQIDWLASFAEQQRLPVLLLTGNDSKYLSLALERAAQLWLPRATALEHPSLLAACLNQAKRWGTLLRETKRAGEALFDCRRQVSRLVDLLAETTPVDPKTRWYAQGHILERLQEETARAERYRQPLAIVRGDYRLDPADGTWGSRQVSAKAAERIGQGKRRSDLVGRFGPHGFLLLLPHTSEEGAVICAKRLKMLLEQKPHPLMTRFGIAARSDKVLSPRSLLYRAEESLERARATLDDTINQ